MLEKEITSLQHPLVKDLVRLRKEKQAREQQGLALIAGKKLVAERAEEEELTMLFLPKEAPVPSHWKIQNLYRTTKEVCKKITGLIEPELLVATIPLPREKSLENMHWILAFDGISDPGNLGTLLRTALSLGWEGVFLLPKCADPFNEKAIRSAKGATFCLPLCSGSSEELLLLSKKNALPIWAADLSGTSLAHIPPSQEGGILILGNESHGISPMWKKYCQRITIPMKEGMESLNVASAGAILMHKLKNHE